MAIFADRHTPVTSSPLGHMNTFDAYRRIDARYCHWPLWMELFLVSSTCECVCVDYRSLRVAPSLDWPVFIGESTWRHISFRCSLRDQRPTIGRTSEDRDQYYYNVGREETVSVSQSHRYSRTHCIKSPRDSVNTPQSGSPVLQSNTTESTQEHALATRLHP